ncbi:9890_t:CDS:2 [Diversispora eburnea]|uniref:9890_t:CDS:1 n=1 Tax=Diversispora eburnea TaxID=1213867 RepID=A0A9N9F6K5_9GLOM|nr:9890_t:CDS:2 [Diversispora eburnea]
MAIVELAALLAFIPASFVALYVWLLQSRKGSLPITTSEVSYNRSKYGNILNWDKYCLYIHGIPTLIISGEFHYWRLPDRSRWKSILKKYRAGGFNCIRIYFHWGYHSPDEGIYHFDGNRDINYLLDLCEELNLYVLAAPGPYICAETQAGGFPIWVIEKVQKLRHVLHSGFKSYDPTFSEYEKQWFENVLPIIARHQITSKSDGCVLAVQIENELLEKVLSIPFGLHDEMRFLCKSARDCEITVPLFTNDPFEAGSFIAKPEIDSKPSYHFFDRKTFGLDLYGFDKYFVFVPASEPIPWAFNVQKDPKKWKSWNPKDVMKALDGIESTVRGFGYEAAKSPIFIPELQGGWFTTYQTQHTFDDVYNYYGDSFTRIVFDSVLAQGCTMLSFYMAYGGTNWGTLGDIDGYTSYDYSACIREYGYISSRLRKLRLGILFAHSFSDLLVKTECVRNPNITTSIKNVFNSQRRSLVNSNNDQNNGVLFTFMRNFSEQKHPIFQVYVKYQEGQRRAQKYLMQCYLPYKSSFIAIGNYITTTGLKLIFSTLPIHLRIILPSIKNEENEDISVADTSCEIWIVPVNNIGEMAFQGEIIVDGNLGYSIRKVGHAIHILSFSGVVGFARIRNTESTKDLYILALHKESLGTLHAVFDDHHWIKTNNRKNFLNHSPLIVTWGTQNVHFDYSNMVIETEHGDQEHEISILSYRKPADHVRLHNHQTYPLSFIYKKQLTAGEKTSEVHLVPKLYDWKTRITNFKELGWRKVDIEKGGGGAIENNYVSGHVLYHAKFQSDYDASDVQLYINMRHRCTIFVNNQFVGGHTTFSRQFLFPGAKFGPELFKSLGDEKYDITQYLNSPESEEKNSMIIFVDNWGLGRQSVVFSDANNPRGIISANIKGLEPNTEIEWNICGVDVSKLENSYTSTGIPDENKESSWEDHNLGITMYGILPNDGIRWWKFKFHHPIDIKFKDILTAPLRLVIYGSFTSYIFLNEILIGRYYGNGDCAQHDFYLMDGILKFGEENQIKMMVYSWEIVDPEEIKLEIRGWEVDDVNKTGNLIRSKKGGNFEDEIDFELKSWIVRKEIIPMTFNQDSSSNNELL